MKELKTYSYIEDHPPKPADLVEVVRCKDCRWWDKREESNYGYCHAAKHGYYSRNWEISIYRTYSEDFFCADGERKGEEDERKPMEI